MMKCNTFFHERKKKDKKERKCPLSVLKIEIHEDVWVTLNSSFAAPAKIAIFHPFPNHFQKGFVLNTVSIMEGNIQ